MGVGGGEGRKEKNVQVFHKLHPATLSAKCFQARNPQRVRSYQVTAWRSEKMTSLCDGLMVTNQLLCDRLEAHLEVPGTADPWHRWSIDRGECQGYRYRTDCYRGWWDDHSETAKSLPTAL